MAAKDAAGLSEIRREWYWLAYDQRKPVRPDQWVPYEPAVQYHLSQSYDAMRMEDRREGLVLDLAPFTSPPSPYQVWLARPVEATCEKEAELLGKLTIAGYPRELWDLPKETLPPSAKAGSAVVGFYQVHEASLGPLEELTRYLTDPTGASRRPAEAPRRRVVLCVEHERPAFLFGNMDRFRRRRSPAAAPPLAGSGESDPVPAGEAIFQWWWGDCSGSWGHWRSYHPHVSARLERALSESEGFRACREAVPIDEVRYMLQRISEERPFDYLEQMLHGSFREPFLPGSRLTVGHRLYDDATRATRNCFVQFQRGNPRRRRPVRRVRRGEAAGLESAAGEPCCVCLSDVGSVLTGCPQGHAVCLSCLWAALRSAVSDVTQTRSLVCGCLGAADADALGSLAGRADGGLQERLRRPPEGKEAQQEFALEMAEVRRMTGLCASKAPDNLYAERVAEWLELVRKRAREHLYHACRAPGCGMENWILREDFDRELRSRGQLAWTCKLGHRNSALPSQGDIDEMNLNVLSHPEPYSGTCDIDGMPLRRFRLCPACAAEGYLTFAVHEAGCKQWPGSTSGHRHQFCFHCTRPWGACGHAVRCRDPGIQQVRRACVDGAEALEIGFVDAQAYISWVQGDDGAPCPPTAFGRSAQVAGLTRQGQLGLEDRAALRRTMQEGTASS